MARHILILAITFILINIIHLLIVVEKRNIGKKAVFGRELADAYQAKKRLPTLIESSAFNDVDHMLSEMILQMTAFESEKRMNMNEINITLSSILGEFDVINISVFDICTLMFDKYH